MHKKWHVEYILTEKNFQIHVIFCVVYQSPECYNDIWSEINNLYYIFKPA